MVGVFKLSGAVACGGGLAGLGAVYLGYVAGAKIVGGFLLRLVYGISVSCGFIVLGVLYVCARWWDDGGRFVAGVAGVMRAFIAAIRILWFQLLLPKKDRSVFPFLGGFWVCYVGVVAPMFGVLWTWFPVVDVGIHAMEHTPIFTSCLLDRGIWG